MHIVPNKLQETITPTPAEIVDAELTTQQAADLLKVSPSFLVEQLEKGLLPCRMVGTQRHLLFSDVVRYKETIDQNRLNALDELAAQAQELGMGY